jgi:hypothetical protein
VQRIGHGQAQVGYSVVERSRGQATLCAVYTVHKERRSTSFLVEPQNQDRRFVSRLASKPLGRFVSGLTSKPLGQFVGGLASKPLGRFLQVWPQNRWLQVFRFGPQNRHLRFDDLAHKITAMVFWFGRQNQAGYSLSVVRQNQWEDKDDTGHASRSGGLLHLKACRARVFQSSLKTGGDAA